jgi:tRNA(fMet)-specific endonuclease VapC
MTHLLDTNTCVGIIRGKSPSARLRLLEVGRDAALCSIVIFELKVGAIKSARPEEEMRKVDAFSVGFTSYEFNDETALIAAEIRAELEKRGQVIGPYDLMIAAIALERDLIVATSNVREFSRAPRLRIEDWRIES